MLVEKRTVFTWYLEYLMETREMLSSC